MTNKTMEMLATANASVQEAFRSFLWAMMVLTYIPAAIAIMLTAFIQLGKTGALVIASAMAMKDRHRTPGINDQKGHAIKLSITKRTRQRPARNPRMAITVVVLMGVILFQDNCLERSSKRFRREGEEALHQGLQKVSPLP